MAMIPAWSFQIASSSIPPIAHGRPIIRGTRLPVSIVVGSLAGGMTFEEVQREYDITADDIRAALNEQLPPHVR